jgi:hypothetical protein
VGSGIPVNATDLTLLQAALEDDGEALDALPAGMQPMVTQTLPVWRRLGVL